MDVGKRWLFARTPWLVRALSLFWRDRSLHVDALRRRPHFVERRGWRSTKRSFSFEELASLTYRFEALPTSFIRAAEPTLFGASRYAVAVADQFEVFVVGVALHDGSELTLFRFYGEGSRATGALGVLFGDDWLDFEGTQADESRLFVRELVRLTGLFVGRSDAEARAEQTLPNLCVRCERRNGARTGCLYCGAELRPAPPRARL